MIAQVRVFLLLMVMSLLSACASTYSGEVTEMALSEERRSTDANGNPITVRVDVWGRETYRSAQALDRRYEGLSYFNIVTVTDAEGNVVSQETIPRGTFDTKIDGTRVFGSSSTENEEPGYAAAGYTTPERAMAAAWSVLGIGEDAIIPPASPPVLSDVTPSAGTDAMLGAIDTATN